LGAISFCFHLFILLISNPFVQLQQVPNQGMGLNPLLEDPALAIHPPILYTGLALLSVLFAISCVGLKTNLLNKDWALLMRPWALACWSFLTLGIALGSWWAYYELGWGGWWFWDPVENLSLLPWLVITALVHSLVSVEKNDSQQFSAALLAVGGFLLALMSLFLVRSGALSSVHAFAVDPLRGGALGIIFFVFALYGIRSLLRFRTATARVQPYYLSRQAFLFLNTLLLLCMAAVVLVGTVYPLILNQLSGHMISVGAPYFNATTLPFLALIILLMAAVPFLNQSTGLQRRYSYVVTFTLAAFVGVTYWKQGWPVFACLFLAASLSVLFAGVLDMIGNWRRLTLRYVAMSLAHVSVAMVIMGAVVDSFEKVETMHVMKEKDSIEFQGYGVTLDKVVMLNAPYFKREAATILVQQGPQQFSLHPEKRYYPLHETLTSETDIKAVGLADFYAVLGSAERQDSWIVKLHWHPAIRLIWIGAGLMVLAGFLGFLAALRKRRGV
jgi:cytochrome c-type biogenesis protein CcmF